MKNKMKLKLTCLFLCFVLSSYAQEPLLNPTITFADITNVIPEFVTPTFDIDASVAQFNIDNAQDASPLVFAHRFDVNLTTSNSGVWVEIDGLKVWRLKIRSSEAKSLMLIIDDLNLVDYSSLFIYSTDMKVILGPYTSNYTNNDILPTPLVPGEEIIVELVYDIDLVTDVPSITISSISHDFVGVTGLLYYGQNEDNFQQGNTLDCHNDVICPIGANWQLEKRSVARMVVGAKAFCSGALINNTNNDKHSYFLTANHCYDDDEFSPEKTCFYFNYESPSCNQGQDGGNYQFVSGSSEVASNGATDFMLLNLNARVPSSFQPYFAGWDRSGTEPTNTTIIHHPAGSVKKITFENDPTPANPVDRIIDGVNYPIGTVWDVIWDIGATQGGSSGSPLFNPEGRIIGQLIGGEIGCPDDTHGDDNNNGLIERACGRLSESWTGSNSTNRLSDWLDPNNTNQTDIEGYAPQGWLHHWVMPWNAPTTQNMFAMYSAMDVGEGNQVFYRGTDNKVHTLYWVNGVWNHAWIHGQWGPNVQNIVGDIKAGAGNQLFYRGQDGKVQTYYYLNGSWYHAWLGGQWAPTPEDVQFSASSAIAVNSINQVFYRGIDQKIQYYYYNGSSWSHGWPGGWNAPNSENISGPIEVSSLGQVYYRGIDGRLQSYYYTNNSWHHMWVDSWNAPTSRSVSSSAKSIVTSNDGTQVFYRGSDNKLQVYYKANNIWYHAWLNSSTAPNIENVAGDIAITPNNEIVYTGIDGRMHIFYYANNQWNHDWIEASWQAPSLYNPSGTIKSGSGSHIFYRGNDGRCRTYYWENGFLQKTSNSENYSMNETSPSPTLPSGNMSDIFEMKVYPNPFSESFTISSLHFNNNDIVNVNVSDITGKTIYNKTLETKKSSEIRIDLTGINSGIYFLKVNDSKGIKAVEKIIKK